MERVLEYGEEAVGSRFQLLVQVAPEASVESSSTETDEVSEPSTPSARSEPDLQKPAYPATEGMPEGINVKVYPLTAKGLVESFLDKCPPGVTAALTSHLLATHHQPAVRQTTTTPAPELNLAAVHDNETFIKSINLM
ncbi:uncharacterized protein LOC134532095 [Bacillus rossius redtenbacheri]|uniref:uncharacterized protein LOC134532095 n=1 Tax=Bacillus rossius redtenbacheri TaxID=93214 RepID=UPI002FDE0848